MGLTFDEAALLLDLRDVYWTRQGLLSIQLSLGLSAVLGSAILGMRMLQRGERHRGGRSDPAPPAGDPRGPPLLSLAAGRAQVASATRS